MKCGGEWQVGIRSGLSVQLILHHCVLPYRQPPALSTASPVPASSGCSDLRGRLLWWLLQPPPLLSLVLEAAASPSTPKWSCLLEQAGLRKDCRLCHGLQPSDRKQIKNSEESLQLSYPLYCLPLLLASTLPSPSQQGCKSVSEQGCASWAAYKASGWAM